MPSARTDSPSELPSVKVAIYDSSRTDGGMQSELRGEGTLRGGCFHIRDAATGDVVLPVYPNERIGVANGRWTFKGTALVDGEPQSVAGGFSAEYDRSGLPAECRATRDIFLVADS